jgi:hypothetical protein
MSELLPHWVGSGWRGNGWHRVSEGDTRGVCSRLLGEHVRQRGVRDKLNLSRRCLSSLQRRRDGLRIIRRK